MNSRRHLHSKRNALTWALLFSVFTGVGGLLAQAPSNKPKSSVSTYVAESATSLLSSRPEEAIRKLEAAADQGLVHPDLSFNRALAYQRRARTPHAQSGDRGQAAAGFVETLHLRHKDPEATRGLHDIHRQVARDKRSKDTSSSNVSLGLLERALLALSPLLLFVLGGAGSLLLCAGQILRWSRIETRHVAGLVSIAVGGILLIASGGLALGRVQLFSDSKVAVVVASHGRLLDQAGGRLKGAPPLREATVVHVGPTERGLVPLIGFGTQSWIRANQLRFIGKSER